VLTGEAVFNTGRAGKTTAIKLQIFLVIQSWPCIICHFQRQKDRPIIFLPPNRKPLYKNQKSHKLSLRQMYGISCWRSFGGYTLDPACHPAPTYAKRYLHTSLD
jgi:hypothetical protein